MSFVSLEFLIFLPLVFGVYWSLNSTLRLQNAFVVLASYTFYGWTDWKYLGIIFGYSLWSYISGVILGKLSSARGRKAVLGITVVMNLGVLGLYKYFNFFVENFAKVFSAAGINLDWPTLNLILPIGISFYTFQALSYTIDVYRRKLQPTRNVIAFFAFLSFFPQLVAGPIERADTLLPQFLKKRHFTYSKGVEGMKLILWGLFKKMVIADNCALIVNDIFNGIFYLNSLTLAVGAILFSFQIYGDFSGYSDIARGCGKLLGIELMENFRLPYFAKNIKEFWQRWHISLNLWLRDYIYIPLGGNRAGLFYTILNILIVFSISGLWHGAQWTYIAWGVANGCMIATLISASALRNSHGQEIATRKGGGNIWRYTYAIISNVTLFGIVTLLWIVFRSPTLRSAYSYIRRMFKFEGGWNLLFPEAIPPLIFIGVLLLIEILNRKRGGNLDFPASGVMKYRNVRWGIYLVMAVATFVLAGSEKQFIYFQF